MTKKVEFLHYIIEMLKAVMLISSVFALSSIDTQCMCATLENEFLSALLCSMFIWMNNVQF